MSIITFSGFVAVCLVSCIWAQALPVYHANRAVSGSVRIWGHGALGHDFMESLMKDWESGFHHAQPGVQFETRMHGTASAIGSLYAGVGDLAIMGREIRPFEVEAFREVMKYAPLGIEVATGSFDVRNKDFALGVFVNRDNPISSLSLTQVDAIFGCEHRRGTKNVPKWGDLGLTEEWADKSIHVYGYQIWRGFADFFRDAVLGGSHKWNPDLREVMAPNDLATDDGDLILDTLSKDRYGIAYCGMHYRNAATKPLALRSGDSGPAYLPTKENCIDRKYPLTRVIAGFINRPPGGPAPPAVAEFLKYILSREGQAAVIREGDYLPLNSQVVREQLRKLE